jgi:hypothetical protein
MLRASDDFTDFAQQMLLTVWWFGGCSLPQPQWFGIMMYVTLRSLVQHTVTTLELELITYQM